MKCVYHTDQTADYRQSLDAHWIDFAFYWRVWNILFERKVLFSKFFIEFKNKKKNTLGYINVLNDKNLNIEKINLSQQ